MLAAVAALLSALTIARVDAQGPLDDVLGDPGITYPDLKPDVQNLFVDGFNDMLRFDTWSMNIGPVALQITAEQSEDPLAPTVSQCVSWYADHVCREQRPVGGFAFHNVHAHFHFQDFATYTLRRLLADGTPDYSTAGIISISEKVSFCLIDIVDIDEDDDSLLPFYTTANCLAPAVMGISPGWADNYDSGIEGQELSVAGLSDGRYALVVDQDPADRLYETDDTNNRVVLILQLSNLGDLIPSVSVVSRQWPTSGSTTTTSTTTTSTTTTSTTTTSTTAPCRGGGGGGGGGGRGGGGGGGGGKCR